LSVSSTDYVWLELTILNSAITAAEIKTVESGGTFDPTLDAWEEDAYVMHDGSTTDPKQIVAKVLLAYINPTDGLVQCVKSDMLAINTCISGNGNDLVAIYCVPHFSPYIAP